VSKYRFGNSELKNVMRRKVIEYLKNDENLDEKFIKYKNLSEEFKNGHLEKLRNPETKFGSLEL
jgi:hypothetical protein